MRNTISKTGLIMILSTFLFGCGANVDNSIELKETTVASSDSFNESASVTEPASSSNVIPDNAITTSGTLMEISDEIDNYGNRQAYFMGDDDVEFIAIISNTTDLPSVFNVGAHYNVSHSDIITMSIPGQYPEVYKVSRTEDDW